MTAQTARIITGFIIIATALGWIAWDIYVMNIPAATESEVVRRWALHPVEPFLLGVLMGHWFGIQWRPGD
jgi:uncharacterized membrane protein